MTNTLKLLELFDASRRALDFDSENDRATIQSLLVALKRAAPEISVMLHTRPSKPAGTVDLSFGEPILEGSSLLTPRAPLTKDDVRKAARKKTA